MGRLVRYHPVNGNSNLLVMQFSLASCYFLILTFKYSHILNLRSSLDDVVQVQGWANFFVGGPNEKSKMSGGPT
jgi:hypothetical protein